MTAFALDGTSDGDRDIAGEASGASRLDASNAPSPTRKYRAETAALPGLQTRLWLDALIEDFATAAYSNFPPIDHQDVEAMISAAIDAYASQYPMIYTGKNLWQSWAAEWAALFAGTHSCRNGKWFGSGDLTEEAHDALIDRLNALLPPDVPIWRRVIFLLDTIAGRRPTFAGYASMRPVDQNFWRVPDDRERKRARSVLVIPVWVGTTPFGPRTHGQIQCAELIAVDPRVPDKWRVRTGDVAILGNIVDLEEAYRLHLPVKLYRNPYRWLVAGGMRSNGFCVLDWMTAEGRELMTKAYSLVAETDEFAYELHKRVRRAVPQARPKIFLSNEATEVAA